MSKSPLQVSINKICQLLKGCFFTYGTEVCGFKNCQYILNVCIKGFAHPILSYESRKVALKCTFYDRDYSYVILLGCTRLSLYSRALIHTVGAFELYWDIDLGPSFCLE